MMLQNPIIEHIYIDKLQAISALKDDPEQVRKEDPAGSAPIFSWQGRWFQLIPPLGTPLPSFPESFEVIGWIERTAAIPFDFILWDSQTNKYYLAILRGRTDGWPLFSVQPEGYCCARSKLGSEWNCRLCSHYFGTTCPGR